ncbi:MAG: transcription initiation factor IIB family protein [Candidatus Lokiarchaeota archaeon]|nr:transcription initiation factor IIB family protein [Candidatus Lokiarchaeota archaeon]
MNSQVCPECGCPIVSNGYQCICSECGLVTQENYYRSSYQLFELNSCHFNQGRQYVSVGKTLETVGTLGSYIDYVDRKTNFMDINGNPVATNLQVLYTRLKSKYSKFARVKNQETNYRIMNILSDVIQILHLNQIVRKDAAYYFRKIKSLNKVIRNNISLIAFCIFFAVRNQYHNAPITINDIADTFQQLGHRVNPRLILRDGIIYRKILHKPQPHKSEDYVNRLIECVVNSPEIIQRLKKKIPHMSVQRYRLNLYNQTMALLKEITIYQRGGRNPFIFAGASIYCADKILASKLCSKSVLTQKLASKAMNIAEYSIRDHYVSVFKRYCIY